MEDRKTIFDYMIQICASFGFTMLCMLCFTRVFGDEAKQVSDMFALGSAGIPLKIMLEFVLLNILVVFWQYVFFTDRFIKKMGTVGRTIWMLSAIIITIVIFIIRFAWFPAQEGIPWLLFFLCFAICFVSSWMLSVAKTRAEDRKLARALQRKKQELEEEE